jgi:putative restriction endonuclease
MAERVMNAFVALTDREWFDFLAAREEVDEVNFWQPHPWGGRFRALSRGEPLLFKLRAPVNAIVGGGFFEHYTTLPFSLAWRAFGPVDGLAGTDDVHPQLLPQLPPCRFEPPLVRLQLAAGELPQ